MISIDLFNVRVRFAPVFRMAVIAATLVLVWTTAFAAGGGDLDRSFNATILKDNTAAGYSVLIQPDGKILYAGTFLNVNQQPRTSIARFNADGTLDTDFDSGGTFSLSSTINAMALQPDGKIVVAGSFSSIAGQTRYSVARLNADGTFDPTLNVPFPAQVSSVTSVAIQSDGKILIGGNFSTIGGQTRNGIARLNADGTLDTSFVTPCSAFSNYAIVIQPDAKILVGSNCGSGSPNVSRLNSNGTLDATFNPGTGTNGSAVRALALQTDGKLLVGGQFSTFNGISRKGIVRLNADGSVDTGFVFTGDSSFWTRSIVVLADGRIVTSRDVANSFSVAVFRLNADGSTDSTFSATETQVGDINSIAVQADGHVVEAGKMQITQNFQAVPRPFLRLTSSGVIDTGWSPYIANPSLNFGVNNAVIQPDGKIIAAGEFLTVNGITRSAVVRLNADGSFDTTFNPVGVFNASITPMALQPDGKLIIGNNATVARLNSDGSNDGTFSVTINDTIKYIGLEPDGRILLAGNFTTVNGQTRNAHFARVNANGATDAFNPDFGGQYYVSSLLVQPDGKFLVGGNFSTVNGTPRGGTVRFNVDGTIDSSFANTDFGFVMPAFLALQPDGKILIAQANNLKRLNGNGAFDAAFPGNAFYVAGNNPGGIASVAVQSDGKLVVGGKFTYIQLGANAIFRNNIARLNADSSVDTGFGAYGGTSGGSGVSWVGIQADKKIVLTGSFTMVNGYGHAGIARLNAGFSPANRLSDFDGDGRADLSVFRPSTSTWYSLRSTAGFSAFQFGSGTDAIAAADYDGDGITDIAVLRDGPDPDKSYLYIYQSATGTVRAEQFGRTGDVPVAGDWDGDGKADPAIYREGTGGGQSFFFYRPSAQPGVDFIPIQWGTAGDKSVRGDFDGDGRLDPAVFRPSTGTWYIRQSSNGQITYQQWGLSTDQPVPTDFDGDGKYDVAVYRNGTWYVRQSSDGQMKVYSWGNSTDVPVPSDYDGDGKADPAVFRNGVWYILQSSTGQALYNTFGTTGDFPVASGR